MEYLLLLALFNIILQAAANEFSEGYTYGSNPLTLTTGVNTERWNRNTTGDSAENVTLTQAPTTQPPQMEAYCSGACDSLPASCYNCKTFENCTYGTYTNFSCEVKNEFTCTGKREVSKKFLCIFCFLTKASVEHQCQQENTSCKSISTPRQRVIMSCTVNEDIFCLGRRKFSKFGYCNWTSGYKWTTALILSVTVGGFGGDRFYLGYWKEGLGKLFSFGGLGVWTLIDIILIGTGYLPPADGSLYIV